MTSEWVDFKEIKTKISMERVLGHYQLLGTLRQTPRGFRGPCPIHKGKHGSQFHVDTEKNRWNCFGGCDMKKLEGHVIGFVAAMEAVSLRDAAILIAKWYDFDTKHPSRKDCPDRGEERPRQSKESDPCAPDTVEPRPVQGEEEADDEEPENKVLSFRLKKLSTEHPFFGERGIAPATIETFGLGFCSKGLMKDRIVFPLHRYDGELIGYIGRTTKEITGDNPKWLLPPGLIKPKVLLNFHRVAGTSRTIILVEGGTSLLAVHQAGFPNVGALLGSDLLEDEMLSYDQFRLIISHFDRVVLLLDGDSDGREGTEKCVERLTPHIFVRSVLLPNDQDPSDLSPAELSSVLSFLK